MNKRLFILLVILMSLSLIGIIFVQFYWIKKSVEDKEEQFSNAVSEVLNKVTDKIEGRERKDYSDRYLNQKDSIGELKAANFTNIMFGYRDFDSNELRLYEHGILEEDYNIPYTFFDTNSGDTTTIKSYTSKRTTTVLKEEFGLDGKEYRLTPIQKLQKIGGLSAIEKAQYEDIFSEFAKKVPIHQRVSKQEIELLLNRELENRSIDTEYEYGVYSKGLPTKIKSKRFKYKANTFYEAPIFVDSEGNTKFSLLISFPEKKKFLISSILGLAVLSLLFTLVIVASYSGAIYQLIRQKQISEIKSDFHQ